MTRTEILTRGNCEPARLAPGVDIRVLVSGGLGAHNLTTCTATMQSGTEIPYHTHPTGEAIALLIGVAEAHIEGRRYQLVPGAALYVPEGVAHSVRNTSGEDAVLHTSFPTGVPDRDFLEDTYTVDDRTETDATVPEHLSTVALSEKYQVGPTATACDLFAGRHGTRGLCGGYLLLDDATPLPCWTVVADVSLTATRGKVVCEVDGRRYDLSGHDTLLIPGGTPHQIFAGNTPAEAIWVYACDEPQRTPTESSQIG